MAGPQAVIGRDVKDQLAAGDGAGKRVGVAQVTDERFDVEILQLAGWADQGTYAMAAFRERPRHVPADEPRGASN
jgi:hypothetical protein